MSEYQKLRELCRSARASLWSARRVSDNAEVVLKIPHAHAEEATVWEYDLLSRINSPRVVRALGLDQEHRALVLAACHDKERLSKRIVREPLSIDETLGVAIAIAQALAAVHGAAIVHAGVALDNVLVSANLDDVVLCGFGAARPIFARAADPKIIGLSTVPLAMLPPELERGGMQENSLPSERALMAAASLEPRVTRENTSPFERAAVAAASLQPRVTRENTSPSERAERGLPSERADLFALGTMLYQLSTGILPAKAARTPPAPKALRSELPQSFSEIVIRLLARDPAQRYTSALGVAADLISARELYNRGELSSRFELDRRGRAMMLEVEGGLVGRSEASRRVLECFASALGGEHRAVAIEGLSGIGKTSLVEHLRPRLEAGGSRFTWGKFDDLHRSRVYGALSDALLRASESLLAEQPELGRQLKEKLGDALGWILRAIPELASTLGGAPAIPASSDAETRARIASAIVKYVSALGELAAPLAIFLDDLQWADQAMMDVLPSLFAETDPRRVFFLLAWRSDQVHAAHPLSLMCHAVSRFGASIERIRLEPFGIGETRTLIEALLQHATMPVELAEMIHERTEGNPFFVRQLVGALVRDRAILRDEESARWICDLELAKKLLFTDRTDSIVAQRIRRLSARTQRALALGAMIGPSIALDDLACVLSQRPARIELDLAPALRDGLLSVIPGETIAYRFVHDRVEAAARASCEADGATVHAEIACSLSAGWRQVDGARLHWLAAQAREGVSRLEGRAEKEELVQLLLAAAASARRSASFHIAVSDLEAALVLLDGNEQRAMLELAECAVANGDFDRADRAARKLEQLGRTPEDRARARLIDTQMHALRHEHEKAVDSVLGGLAMLGVTLSRCPPRWRVAGALIATELAIKRRSLKKIEALPRMEAERPRLALALLSAAMGCVYQTGDRDLFAMCALSMVRLSLAHGHADGSGFAMVVYGMLRIIALQDLKGGGRYGRLGLRISALHDAPPTQCRARVVHQQFVHPWTEDQLVRQEDVLRAHALGRDSGELTYAGYAFGSLLTAFANAEPLAELSAVVSTGAAYTERTGDVGATVFANALVEKYRRFRVKPENDEDTLPAADYARLGNAWRLWWQGHRAFVATLEKDPRVIKDAVDKARGIEDAGAASWMGFILAFCGALHGTKVRPMRSFLKKWERTCPKIARAYRQLLEGTLAKKDAPAYFERAVEAATAAGQFQIAHLAARYAAEAHQKRGATALARAFEIIQREQAARWGATLLAEEPNAPSKNGSLQARAVSHALLEPLAKEIETQQIAERAIEAAVELAHAEAATLFLRAKDAWKTVAGSAEPSSTLLSAALHSNEPRVIPDPKDSAKRSLVVPLWRAGSAVGAMVLEGARPDGEGVASLAALAAPIAVLLENAELRAELIHARQDARSAAQAKALLLSNVSHELRTPLHGILGTLEHLDTVALGDRAKELIAELGVAANGLRRSLGALLEYVDAESGEHALESVAFDLHRLIQSTAAPHRAKAAEKKLCFELELELDRELPRCVKGDPIRLGHVLDQVLDNAVKFTELGSVRLEARVASGELQLAIADTGPGMSEEQRARAFDTLRQRDSSSTKTHAGLGVGLAFVQRAMHVLDGSIAIASENGAGTRVELRVPIAVLDRAMSPRVVEKELGPRDLVLVAEDNPVNQKLMARTLEKLGFAFQVCEDGEAVTLAYRERAERVLCVLMDCQMPKMDGYEASVQIRAFEESQQLSRVPILAVTANAMAQDRQKCLQAGMDDHLPKPVRSADLAAAFARWTSAETGKEGPNMN